MWEIGHCFRCDREDLLVIRVGELTGDGRLTTIYACRNCAARLTVMHEQPPAPLVPLYITARTP
jgi:hypothetical protein